ncbi:hypothetical protein [Mesorhizobium onobrychidis]|uniref:Uncharacterized protein n=1 Tax=Mesorhizobium onobrychidis TaxID=2775404 RepID=A0ABY5QYG7_9HYPH|nr:hypothetical protein [Mesorhizobium onobrychidis]UVC15497.1 hypothetical protein IHQ72_34560 [Mesorhizobium onobrychidis]
MKAGMSAYGVTELAPEEASAISGGMIWALVFAFLGTFGLAAVSIIAKAVDGNH